MSETPESTPSLIELSIDPSVDPVDPVKRKEFEKKLRQQYAEIEKKRPDLLKQGYSDELAKATIAFIAHNTPEAILELRNYLIANNTKGVVMFQQVSSGVMGLPVPEQLLFSSSFTEGNPPDEYVQGMRRFFSEFAFEDFIVVGVTTEDLDSAFSVFFVEDLKQMKNNPEIAVWEADIKEFHSIEVE